MQIKTDHQRKTQGSNRLRTKHLNKGSVTQLDANNPLTKGKYK
jgi:hypothetical protein